MADLHYTNHEQSKKLMDVGLPANSADMCYTINDELKMLRTIPTCIPYRDFTAKEFYLPCWSTGELLRLLNLCTLRPTPEYEDDYIGYLVSAIYDRIKRNKTNPGTFDLSKLADYERD